jgi:hypothetical protein
MATGQAVAEPNSRVKSRREEVAASQSGSILAHNDGLRRRPVLIVFSCLVVDFTTPRRSRVNNKSQLSGTTRPGKANLKRLNQIL